VAGIGVFLLLSRLWAALAVDSGVDFVNDNLEWFNVVSAIVALAIGGFLAGYLSGLRGIGPGAVNGLSAWGLFVTIGLLVGEPGPVARIDEPLSLDAFDPASPLWEAFWAILAALVVAVLFGAIGGLVTRSRELFDTTQYRSQDRPSGRGVSGDDVDLDLTQEPTRPSYRSPTPGA
jgi:hypothetical protein